MRVEESKLEAQLLMDKLNSLSKYPDSATPFVAEILDAQKKIRDYPKGG